MRNQPSEGIDLRVELERFRARARFPVGKGPRDRKRSYEPGSRGRGKAAGSKGDTAMTAYTATRIPDATGTPYAPRRGRRSITATRLRTTTHSRITADKLDST